MNTKSFNDLIEDAKLWVDQEFSDQKAIVASDYEPPSEKIAQKIEIQKPIDGIKKSEALDKFISTHDLSSVEVFLITRTQDGTEKILVEKLASAIDTRIAKAKLIYADEIEKNNLWQELFTSSKKLRHVLISEVEFYQLTSLIKHYQRMPKRSVFNVPLFLLTDLKCYNQDVELKKSLWATLLCEL